MIDTTDLHPNWKQIHLNHINQLEMMIAENHWQASEAKQLLDRAKKEIADIEKAVEEQNTQSLKICLWCKESFHPRSPLVEDQNLCSRTCEVERERFFDKRTEEQWRKKGVRP